MSVDLHKPRREQLRAEVKQAWLDAARLADEPSPMSIWERMRHHGCCSRPVPVAQKCLSSMACTQVRSMELENGGNFNLAGKELW